jgi:phage head maturation protease
MSRRYAYCEVKSLEGENPNGEFEAILSAATLDRDGEIIDARAFHPLPERIPIDIDHGMTVATTVGSGTPYYDGDVLKIKGTFSSIDRAQELRTLVAEGHIASMSVTFMDADRQKGDDGLPHIKSAELLNAAFVPIPSNREATVLVAKAFAPTDAEIKATKADRLQNIHDLAVLNGASCDSPAARSVAATDTTAPEPPAPVAGKAPASVVTQARTTLARALLDL